MKNKHYECLVSFSYDAKNPVEAAKQFIANIQANPNWYVQVREIKTGKAVIVDTKTSKIE